MFGDAWHLVLDLTEESDDKLHGGHGLLHAQQGFTLPMSLEDFHDHCNLN